MRNTFELTRSHFVELLGQWVAGKTPKGDFGVCSLGARVVYCNIMLICAMRKSHQSMVSGGVGEGGRNSTDFVKSK